MHHRQGFSMFSLNFKFAASLSLLFDIGTGFADSR
jgi:hypothetical protein